MSTGGKLATKNVNQLPKTETRSFSREVRIRAPTFSAVYFCRGTLPSPKKGTPIAGGPQVKDLNQPRGRPHHSEPRSGQEPPAAPQRVFGGAEDAAPDVHEDHAMAQLSSRAGPGGLAELSALGLLQTVCKRFARLLGFAAWLWVFSACLGLLRFLGFACLLSASCWALVRVATKFAVSVELDGSVWFAFLSLAWPLWDGVG